MLPWTCKQASLCKEDALELPGVDCLRLNSHLAAHWPWLFLNLAKPRFPHQEDSACNWPYVPGGCEA